MATQTFHLFPQLPEELRRDIWEWTFAPRLISLKCGIEFINQTFPPPFVYEVAPQPYELVGIVQPQPFVHYDLHYGLGKLRSRPDFTSAYLTVDEDYATPSALSVHRESREWAKSDGYIAWRIRSAARWRNIMWNPKKDVVDFFENHNSSLSEKGLLMKPVTLLSMLARQFPFETTEVRYLSIPSRYWGHTGYLSNTVTWPLIHYISLRELAVVVDRVFEAEQARLLEAAQWRAWSLPDDLNQNLQDIRDHYERWWPERHPLPKQPSVRVVMTVDGIFDGEDKHMDLRCHPCHALGI